MTDVLLWLETARQNDGLIDILIIFVFVYEVGLNSIALNFGNEKVWLEKQKQRN